MRINCIAIDDEPLALELIRAYIIKTPSLHVLRLFEDALSAGEYLRSNTVDLVFIDIQMPDISGLDLVRSLQNKPMIIFTTAHKKFAFEGFELEAIDYLLKPISFDRFSKAVTKAADYFQYKNSPSVNEEYLYVYSEYKLIKINVNDIEYIESLEDYVKIHLNHFKPVMSLMTLKKIFEKLPSDKFERIHRSYIVAINKIQAIANKKVILANIELPVSDSYLNVIRKLKKS
jgi:DNA-binding LytR/AlgR family response regulator